MSATTPAPWPPSPDLESIRELVRNADIEGFIQDGAPADEYDTEAEELHAAIAHLPTAEITASRQLPILESIWSSNFTSDETQLALRRPAFQELAEQIARFFGPEAQPQTRQ